METTFARAQELAGILTDAGLRVTADTRNINPPCALLTPPARLYDTMNGFTAEWHIWLLVPGSGTADSWIALDGMLTILESALSLESADPAVLPVTTGLAPLPAMDCIYRENLA